MLTAPPEPDHAEIVVRYLPAAEAARVGGDWYDAFVQPDGATCWSSATSSATTSPRRRPWASCAACCAASRSPATLGPAGLLAQLDTAMTQLQLHTYATAALARFEQTPEDARPRRSPGCAGRTPVTRRR